MDQEMYEQADSKFIPMTSITSGAGREVAHDVYYYTDQIANIIFVGDPDQGDWVLVDAGLPKSAPEIRNVVTDRFGRYSRPNAIILTHGHFDHIGGLVELVNEWGVPVYAHELELPYLTGKESYPKPDTTVEGGMIAKMSSMFPIAPIQLGSHIHALPADYSVPEMPGWRWIHTSGHSKGHISLFRESDRLLLAGDAFTTVRQDSLYKVLMQVEEVNGPPRYLTTDWQAAKLSVEKLAVLEPETVISGHGIFMTGDKLKKSLQKLVDNFDEIALPNYGHYIEGKDQLH